MAKIVNTNEEVTIKKEDAKNAAARFVLSWASVNENNKEEDFFQSFSEDDLLKNKSNPKDLILNNEEKEWIRKEFETISNIIRSRIKKR